MPFFSETDFFREFVTIFGKGFCQTLWTIPDKVLQFPREDPKHNKHHI